MPKCTRTEFRLVNGTLFVFAIDKQDADLLVRSVEVCDEPENLLDQHAALANLPVPTPTPDDVSKQPQVLAATGTDGSADAQRFVRPG